MANQKNMNQHEILTVYDEESKTPFDFGTDLKKGQRLLLYKISKIEQKAKLPNGIRQCKIVNNGIVGKTVAMIAYLSQRRIIETDLLYIATHQNPKGKFLPKMFRRYNETCNSTIIIATEYSIISWKRQIKEFSHKLTHITINNAKSYQEFIEIIKDNYSKAPDIIFIKPCNIQIQQLDIFDISIIEIFNDHFKHILWNRLIIDNYDIIKLKNQDSLIASKFTWFISKTNREKYRYINVPVITESNISSFLESNAKQYILSNALDNIHIISIDEEMMWKLYKFITSLKKIIVKVPDKTTFITKINIQCELMQLLLEKNYNKYFEILRLKNRMSMIADVRSNSQSKIKVTHSDLKNMSNESFLQKVGKIYIDQSENINKKSQKKYMTVKFNRFIENTKEEMCQSCKIPFYDCDSKYIYITNCCQIIICEYCVESDPDNDIYIERCPNCISILNFNNGLLKIDKNMLSLISSKYIDLERMELESIKYKLNHSELIKEFVKYISTNKGKNILVFANTYSNAYDIFNILTYLKFDSVLVYNSTQYTKINTDDVDTSIIIIFDIQHCIGLDLSKIDQIILYMRAYTSKQSNYLIDCTQKINRVSNLDILELCLQ